MRVIVNGRSFELDSEIPLVDFLLLRGWDSALVAVEHNLKWLARDDWPSTTIREGDRLEIVRIMAGG